MPGSLPDALCCHPGATCLFVWVDAEGMFEGMPNMGVIREITILPREDAKLPQCHSQ